MAQLYSRITLKDHLRETQLFTNRVISFVIIIIILTLALVSRMLYLQVVNHEHFTTLSQNNRVNIIPVPPPRGLIYDVNGVVLAQNLPSFTLELIPEKIKDIAATISRLKKFINIEPSDIKRFNKLKRRRSNFKAVPLRFRLNEEEVALFSVRRHKFPGVDINAQLIRHYPHGELAVHALGYVGRINEAELQRMDTANYNGTSHIGKNGIEKFYEDYLHGSVGFKKIETNAQGRIIRVLEEQRPIPGKNIYLNLDIELQKTSEKILQNYKGAIVAINPKTGAILALASMPGFDPNPFVNGIDSKSYSALVHSEGKPLFNRAIKGSYPPGSTIKPIIGLAGLEFDVVHGATELNCPGWYRLKNDAHRYRDWKKEGHAKMTLLDSIKESCDVYFYDLALNLGIDRIHEFMDHFGFGKKTNIDLFGETAGLSPSREWKNRVKHEMWYPGETLITGIGQGFNLTSPLQLATATAVLANDGKLLRPRLAHSIEDGLSKERTVFQPVTVSQVPIKNHENWNYIIESMKRVIHSSRGTARSISVGLPYKIAGKTGTAQVFGIKQDETYIKEEIEIHLRDHALFIAFAPIKNPQIAISVIVENGGGGGAVAAPIARKVLDEYILRKKKS